MCNCLSGPYWLLVVWGFFFVQNVPLIHAFWAVDCGVVATERTDPIRFFGESSQHVHVIAGSSAIAANATNADLRGGGMPSATFLASFY